MKLIHEFVSRFGAEAKIDKSLMVREQNRYFLLNESLKKVVSEGFFHAGTYLGRVKNNTFLPSFNLLRIIAEGKANRVIVNEKTEWLFICGRDIFKSGIVKVTGSRRRGHLTLVLNKQGECLGFGRILCNLDETRKGAVIENILDIGDFLRRERRAST